MVQRYSLPVRPYILPGPSAVVSQMPPTPIVFANKGFSLRTYGNNNTLQYGQSRWKPVCSL